MKLKSLNTEKNMLHNISKNLSHFTNFPANMFLVGVRKNIWTALWKQMPVYFFISL